MEVNGAPFRKKEKKLGNKNGDGGFTDLIMDSPG